MTTSALWDIIHYRRFQEKMRHLPPDGQKKLSLIYCEMEMRKVPLADYRTRFIWEKIGCRLFPFCHQTPLPDLLECDCKYEKLHCARCKRAYGSCVHHLSYGPEALPRDTDNSWVKYYRYLCDSCHRKEHYAHPELNNRKEWEDTTAGKWTVV